MEMSLRNLTRDHVAGEDKKNWKKRQMKYNDVETKRRESALSIIKLAHVCTKQLLAIRGMQCIYSEIRNSIR